MSIPYYCIPRGIKLQTFPISPNFYPKTPKRGVNELAFLSLKLKIQLALIKNTAPIQTKFCTVTKTTKYCLWVVQAGVQQIQDGGRPLS